MIAPEPIIQDIIQEPSIADSATHRSPENIPPDILEAKGEDNIVANAAAPNNAGAFWVVFLSTFITIFLAELGDKTQLATLLLSAESQSPLVVFLGAGLALVATSLIGVLLGQWLSKRIPEETLDTCAGILLLLITIGLVGDIVGH